MSAIPAARSRRFSLGSVSLTVAAITVFIFLYIPLAIIVLYSFSGEVVNVWPIGSYTTR